MADKDIKKEELNKNTDPELDELLDSALQEMIKKPETAATVAAEAPAEDAEHGLPPNMWTEDFIKEAAQQFESNMATLLGNYAGIPEDQLTQEQIAQTFTKIADAAANAFKSSEAPAEAQDVDVNAAISNTMRCLNANAEAIQAPFTDQDLSNMFSSLSTDGGEQGNMFVPFIQGMMQSLLSKEVLYPSLKELLEKYPAYLEENKGKIEQSEYERFCKQKDLMEKVCLELEPEQESDPEEVKRKRFDNVLELMQKMQDLGQPPKELGGDIYNATAPGLLAPNAMSKDTPNCNIM